MNGQQTSAGPHRRAVLTAGGALLTSSIFTGKVKGANDRLALAVIGMGNMGTGHLRRLLKMPKLKQDPVVSRPCIPRPLWLTAKVMK